MYPLCATTFLRNDIGCCHFTNGRDRMSDFLNQISVEVISLNFNLSPLASSQFRKFFCWLLDKSVDVVRIRSSNSKAKPSDNFRAPDGIDKSYGIGNRFDYNTIVAFTRMRSSI